MPDLSPLPTLPPAPAFAPAADRFDRTVSVARRRRAVRTSVPLAAVTAVAAVVLTLPAGGGDSRGLDVADLPTGTPVPTPSATLSAGPDGVRAGAAAGPSLSAAPSSSPTPGPASPTAGPRPSEEPPSPEPAPRPDPSEPRPASRSVVAYDGTAGCHTGSGNVVNGWCVRSRGATLVESGADSAFVLEVCRPAGPGTLRFQGPQEVFATVSADAESQSFVGWFAPDPAAGPHELTVASATCVRWVAPWRVADTDGKPLEPGRYSVGLGDMGREEAAGSPTGTPSGDVYDLTVG